METILTNGRIVTTDDVLLGTVAFADGSINAVDARTSALAAAVDCEGDFLLPGFVDLHTDNLERHLSPRPGVRWPSALGAVLAHDREMLASGITTVFDALSLGDYDSAGERRIMLDAAIGAFTDAGAARLLKADHFLHFRCEVSDGGVTDIFDRHAANARLKLVSLMDHTPGQRQWSNLAVYRDFRRKKNARVWTDAEFEAYLHSRREFQVSYATRFREHIRQAAAARGLTLASHDDTTESDVDQAHAEDIRIAEFPTTLGAARRAKELGLKTIMGAPNVVLGRSHSGNVGAAELADHGLLDALSSDYVPASLLEAVFLLADRGFSLPNAVATASARPAAMLGLSDRGAIAPGLNADLLRVRIVGGVPVLRAIWRGGRQVM